MKQGTHTAGHLLASMGRAAWLCVEALYDQEPATLAGTLGQIQSDGHIWIDEGVKITYQGPSIDVFAGTLPNDVKVDSDFVVPRSLPLDCLMSPQFFWFFHSSDIPFLTGIDMSAHPMTKLRWDTNEGFLKLCHHPLDDACGDQLTSRFTIACDLWLLRQYKR